MKVSGKAFVILGECVCGALFGMLQKARRLYWAPVGIGGGGWWPKKVMGGGHL